jgi:hypothetical protein
MSIGSSPVTWSAAPPISGTMNWPPGMRLERPRKPSAIATSSVATNGPGTNGAVPEAACAACATGSKNRTRDASEAVSTTSVTRRYCMNATMRGSAP